MRNGLNETNSSTIFAFYLLFALYFVRNDRVLIRGSIISQSHCSLLPSSRHSSHLSRRESFAFFFFLSLSHAPSVRHCLRKCDLNGPFQTLVRDTGKGVAIRERVAPLPLLGSRHFKVLARSVRLRGFFAHGTFKASLLTTFYSTSLTFRQLSVPPLIYQTPSRNVYN